MKEQYTYAIKGMEAAIFMSGLLVVGVFFLSVYYGEIYTNHRCLVVSLEPGIYGICRCQIMAEKVIIYEVTSDISETDTSQEWYEEFMRISFILIMYSFGYIITGD